VSGPPIVLLAGAVPLVFILTIVPKKLIKRGPGLCDTAIPIGVTHEVFGELGTVKSGKDLGQAGNSRRGDSAASTLCCLLLGSILMVVICHLAPLAQCAPDR